MQSWPLLVTLCIFMMITLCILCILKTLRMVLDNINCLADSVEPYPLVSIHVKLCLVMSIPVQLLCPALCPNNGILLYEWTACVHLVQLCPAMSSYAQIFPVVSSSVNCFQLIPVVSSSVQCPLCPVLFSCV